MVERNHAAVVEALRWSAKGIRTNQRVAFGAALALCVLGACGRSKSHVIGMGPDGAGGSLSAGASGESTGGRAGAPESDAGEAGSSTNGRGGALGAAGDGASGGSGAGGGASDGGTPAGAVGGQSAGASSGTGAAGTSGQPPLLLPEDCEPRGQSEDADTCSLGVFCDSVPNLTNCLRLASGRWQCACELANKDRVYEIEGAPGIQACAVAAGLCFDDDLELGEETCTAESESSGVDSCELELACATPISVSFAPDVSALLMEYGSASCARFDSSVPFECGCSHDGTARDYGVLAVDGTLACRPLVDFCISELGPVFDEPTQCFESAESSTNDGCTLSWTCATPMRLTEDVSLALLESRYADCTPNGSSGSSCYCSTPSETFRFDLEAEPLAETCEASILNCAENVRIKALGEPECHATSQHADADFCEADLDCSQPATVGESEVLSRGRLLVYCRQATPAEPWRCACASNQDSTTFEFGHADLSAWEVCSLAPEGCLVRMPVFVGPYGEYMPPPDPLAP
jgi:hypothetical protein